jgi:hypothetical protein
MHITCLCDVDVDHIAQHTAKHTASDYEVNDAPAMFKLP